MKGSAPIACLVAAGLSLPALADVPTLSGNPCAVSDELDLSEHDEFRLAHLMTSRTRGLAAALNDENPDERAAVEAIYSAGLAPLSTPLAGRYQCRTIKMGGGLPLVVYDWFECEIREGASGLEIEKLTGSQRFSGTLTPAGEGLAYRGALHYHDEGPRPYDGASDRDQTGCLLKSFEDGGPLVLELPMPHFESYHDVIEMRAR